MGENVLLAVELIRKYESPTCGKSSMLKIDIRKAFDTICWDFVIKVLQAQGFPPIFVTWIRECISTPRFSVAINGELAGFFPGKKGLRQGDAISPYLFIMVMEVLSKLLEKAVEDGAFRVHPNCLTPRVTHLLFADDLLVFTDGSRFSISGVKDVMAGFKSWTGLDMNAEKSEIFFGGYTDLQATVISDITGFKRGSFPTRYLGLPLSPKKISYATLQPFLERISTKLNSWTVKTLSFAGKITLVSSVIYGMVNFWSSVFSLPKRFYATVDSMCASFLWKNRTTSASGARVSWEDICKPKNEGGLGIRRLEEFQLIFELKRVWNFFSESGSIWVAWLRHNVLCDQRFWTVSTSSNLSSSVNRMLQLKPKLNDLMRCNVGDGKTASFWYDWWTDLGPLISVFGARGPRDLQIPLHSTVSSAAANGDWFLPPARSHEAETLQLVLSTMQPPSDSRGKDVFLWRNGDWADWSFSKRFSSKATWNLLRQRSPVVPWCNLVWFKEAVPRFSFVSWMTVLARLPTRDRLISWGMTVPAACTLCSSGLESHAHMFFNCTFSSAVWSHFAGWMFSTPPVSPDSVITIIDRPYIASCPGAATVIKLLAQVIVYCLWNERNHRIFRQVSSTEAAIISRVDRLMRDRLLSLPPPREGSASYLLLFLSSRSFFPP